MKNIEIYNRETKTIEIEKVYAKNVLYFLYGNSLAAKILLFFIKKPLFSKIYGVLKKTKFSRRKIKNFVEKFNIETSEFIKKTSEFKSFNDFFIRELKKESRPIEKDEKVLITPSDARYLVYENSKECFFIKNEKFYLKDFLQNEKLAKDFENGPMVIIRLNPTDYHRFHFPCNCKASKSKLINGYLYSVNPFALYKNYKIFKQNKRVLTILETEKFGKILFVEIGATAVGSINQTFSAEKKYLKGDQKGYFSFGGSSIVMLFEKDKIKFDEEFLKMTKKNVEVYSKFGKILGKIPK